MDYVVIIIIIMWYTYYCRLLGNLSSIWSHFDTVGLFGPGLASFYILRVSVRTYVRSWSIKACKITISFIEEFSNNKYSVFSYKLYHILPLLA